MPGIGMATIWDADVLIWAGSQVVAALDRGMVPGRRLRFTPYQLLPAIGRPPGQRQYALLKAALQRLQSTLVRTSIRQETGMRRRQFSWLDEWSELIGPGGRVRGMEIVLADWAWQGVLDRSLALAIDPAYFHLTGGLERWLYRVARKHAGRQRAGWAFDVTHLHAKSGSLMRQADFTLALRRIAARQPLPGYALAMVRRDDGTWLLRLRAVDRPVDKPVDAM